VSRSPSRRRDARNHLKRARRPTTRPVECFVTRNLILERHVSPDLRFMSVATHQELESIVLGSVLAHCAIRGMASFADPVYESMMVEVHPNAYINVNSATSAGYRVSSGALIASEASI